MNIKTTLITILGIITIPIWFPLVTLSMFGYFLLIQPIEKLCLKRRVRNEWYPQGKYLLFVYSNSPVWKDYIEENILPRVTSYGIVLNWSERQKWAWNSKLLEVKVFKTWANVSMFKANGKRQVQGYEYNPIAIVFNPNGEVKVFKLWKAFKDYKHGKTLKLNEIESGLIKTIEDLKGSAIRGSC